MTAVGNPIEAVLTLNATSFHSGINDSVKAVDKLKSSINKFSTESSKIETTLTTLFDILDELAPAIQRVNTALGNVENLKNFSLAVKRISESVVALSDTSIDVVAGVTAMNEIFASMDGVLGSTTINVRGLKTALREVVEGSTGTTSTLSSQSNAVKNLRNSYGESLNTLRQFANAMQPVRRQMEMMEAEFERSKTELLNFVRTGIEAFTQLDTRPDTLRRQLNLMNAEFERSRAELMEFARIGRSQFEQVTVGAEKLAGAEEKVVASTNQATSSMERYSSASRTATAQTNAQTSATNKLRSAMSSLKMIGSLVASMMVWNFASSLINATRETVNAKSEMEGYFQMLHFSTSQVNDFNKALDETIKKFPRLNKYSLGETISSIGVEFNLTTEEMKKAMPVVSMITSEYLRAGRNANEASLAVKDILQGEFQRLSRETGVKGDQLKEAGWSGDKTDVMGLLEALDKVGKSRNWDVFVSKANSLNDAVLILQNRFGEWSAEMVNAVQPAILNAFNSIMNFAEGLSQSISGLWQWLNGGSWGAIATQIGLITSAIFVGVHSLTAWRTGATLSQVANMGLTKSLAGLVLGIKAEEMATKSVSSSIAMKILGVKSEQVAEIGLTNAINRAVFTKGLYKTTTEAETLASQLKAGTLVGEATAVNLVKDAETGAIVLKEGLTIATTQNTASTIGFTGALSMMIAGEQLAEGETLSLTGALGALTGAFLTSPVGWFAMAILGLASAFYVLTGGLSDCWEKMKEFNEVMKDTGSAQNEAHKWLLQYTEDHKNEADAVKNANEQYETYVQNLQSAKYWYDHSQTAFNGLDLTAETTGADVLKKHGITKQDADEWNNNIDTVVFGKKRYYQAEQVLNKQLKDEHSDYAKDLDWYLTKVQQNGGDIEEAYSKMTGNYENLAKHSYIANTSDDWWEKSWNQLYAGLDQIWIDWDKFWADPNWAGAIDGMLKGLGNFDGVKELREAFGINGDSIVNFFSDESLDKFYADFFKSLPDPVTEFSNWVANASMDTSWLDDWINKTFVEPFNSLGDRLMECIENIATYDYIGAFLSYWNLTDFNILDLFFGQTVSASDGSSDHPPVLDEINQVLVQPIVDFANNLVSDPLGTLGVEPIDFIAIVFPQLFGLYEGATGIATWVDTNIIQPLKNGISQGIASIPIVGDIASMLGLVPQQNQNAHNTGYNLIDHLRQGVEQKIGEIPIIGDIARMLGLIPSQNGNANEKGYGIGDNIKRGEAEGQRGIADQVRTEMGNVVSAISKKAGEVYAVAHDIGSKIINGIKDAMDMHSPSILSRELIANEFGVYIPQAISSSGEIAYTTAQSYGQSIMDGISSVDNNFSLGGVADEYQSDAQTIATYSQMMGTDTTMAFNDMTLAVNGATTQMSTNVASTYSQIQTRQATMLNSMKSSNLTAYQQMNTQSNQSLLQMRDSTSNVTNQMINAWTGMKDSIVATANSLRSETTAHFNTLSSNIGSFYRKIQNPSNWGAGHSSSLPTRGARNSRLGKAFVSSITSRSGNHGAGGNARYSPYTGGNATMSLRQLKHMICPRGNCDIFDGYDMSQVVNVSDFLSTITGEHGFGWTGWNRTHYQHIRSRSNEWGMKSPILNVVGGIPTNANFKVGEFETGTPKISFGAFQSMAESLFSNVPYAFYYDSEKYGSWQNALAHGECNCSDGADALLAFASTCGFSGSKVHGTWVDPDGTTYGHFYTIINGKKMDTTGWQQRRSWSAGSPPTSSKPASYGDVNVTINVYGDDVEVDENAVDLSTAQTIIDLVGINPSTGV